MIEESNAMASTGLDSDGGWRKNERRV